MAAARGVRDDRGTTVVGWLLRIALGLGAVGVVGFDAASIGVTHLTLDDTAADAAVEARQAYVDTRDPLAGFRAALTRAKADSTDISLAPGDFSVARDAEVRLTLNRTAHTLLAHRVPGLQQFTVVSAAGTARPPTAAS